MTSVVDDSYNVYTFNAGLKRQLADFAKKHPALCCFESEDKKTGCQSVAIDKVRLIIRITEPYSEERRKASSERAKRTEFNQVLENSICL